MNLNQLDTEQSNPDSLHIDEMSTIDILTTINNEDQKVALAVKEVLPKISIAVDCIYYQMCKGGRLIYIGAGTSGRLGILDASECPPTYGVDPRLVQGLIAGGKEALTAAIEGAEDSQDFAVEDLKNIHLTDKDVVCGIHNGEISKYSHYPIEVITGPEVIAGSTRMKAGTAQKLVLNMISTSVMIKRGKVYKNLMVDLQPTNEKLKTRAINIVSQSLDCSKEESIKLLTKCHYNVKIAILSGLTGKDEKECEEALLKNNGSIPKTMR